MVPEKEYIGIGMKMAIFFGMVQSNGHFFVETEEKTAYVVRSTYISQVLTYGT